MIARLRGELLESSFTGCVIEAGGVGYEILIPVSTFEKLPHPGSEAVLLIHTQVREDAITLYGFATAGERDLFRQLIDEVRHITPAMGYAASATALKIVHQALGYAGSGSDGELLVNEFCKTVEKLFSSRECSIDSIASLLGVSRVTLFRTVTGRINCTPKEYLDKYRLREAVDLLINTTMNINDIALRCGYSGANYFCKVFRKQLGTSPEIFRRNSR